jgi:hypothetical protein
VYNRKDMIEEELVKIWQSSSNQERIKFEKSRLMIDVQAGIDRFHRKIKFRDMTEQLAIILVAPVFIYSAFTTPHLLSKIASVLIVIWGIFVAVRLRMARKHQPVPFTEAYLGYLNKTKVYLGIQKQLLDSILYWYILPGFCLVSLFLLGPIDEPEKLPGAIKVFAGNVIVAVVIYVLNKRAVTKEVVPKIEKVDELIAVMEKS